jgi:hypothetical protein
MWLCGCYRFTRRQRFSCWVRKLLFSEVSTDLKEGKKRLGIFFGGMWNTDSSVANIVSVFKASWICLLDRTAVPQYFWPILVQLRKDKRLNLLVQSHRLCREKSKRNNCLVSWTQTVTPSTFSYYGAATLNPVFASPPTVPAGVTRKLLGDNCEVLPVLFRRNTITKKGFALFSFLMGLNPRWCFESLNHVINFVI